jgi:pyruvate-formate lyase
MNQQLIEMKERVRARKHAEYRQKTSPDVVTPSETQQLSWMRRAALLTCMQCEAENPIILKDENLVFLRTVPTVPMYDTPEGWKARFQGGRPHELGPISNICPDWSLFLSQGLLGRRVVAMNSLERFSKNEESVEFLNSAISTIDAVLNLVERYMVEADRLGRSDVVEILNRVPAQAPGTFKEALQALIFIRAVIWLSGHYHVGLGRFDQYMWPYLHADLQNGRLTLEEAEALLAEFFICLNKDSDLYPGIQQGDNGQSLMLGGVDKDGKDACNELTRMALRVARDVSMIDPKINLRMCSDTPLDLLELASELTKQGLGFPQYSNDDVVIPGLVAHGYALEDARNYTVAACWEYSIPGKAMDIVNIGAVSMPAATDKGIREGLLAGDDFNGILERTREDIFTQVDSLMERSTNIVLPPAPFYSCFMNDCLEKGQDLSKGADYNNLGIHGACSSNAADSLAATKYFVFDQKSVSPKELLNALDANFEGYEDLKHLLRNEAPKIGNNDDEADRNLVLLFDYFADACSRHSDPITGRVIRPGTGSAMYYVWLARGAEDMKEPVVGATADGRKSGDFFSSSLAPSPGVTIRGPISILQTFGKIDYNRVCNGGPITLELSDTVFKGRDSIHKVGMLIRSFAQTGCQQLQLNTLNVETLKDARLHPEKHKNLIVRVWGWSGYFCELSPEYQDHIIGRHMLG